MPRAKCSATWASVWPQSRCSTVSATLVVHRQIRQVAEFPGRAAVGRRRPAHVATAPSDRAWAPRNMKRAYDSRPETKAVRLDFRLMNAVGICELVNADLLQRKLRLDRYSGNKRQEGNQNGNASDSSVTNSEATHSDPSSYVGIVTEQRDESANEYIAQLRSGY